MSTQDSPMGTVELDRLHSDSQQSVATSRSLRWWPAALILVAMATARFSTSLIDGPSLPFMMISFMGPAALGLLILVWWCFASRASWKEKLAGIVGFLFIAILALTLLHPTLKGMSEIVSVIPMGIAAFAIGLLLFAKSVPWRVPVALLFSLLAFGYWDLKQSEGTTGDFRGQFLWRWSPNAETSYLAELAKRRDSAASKDSGDKVTLASSPWPAFRGPDRTGIVENVVLASDWQSNPPKEIWRTKIGPAWSSFSVAGNRLFTQEQRGDDEAVVCLDAKTGKLLWDYTYPSRFWEAIAGAGPRATPTIADEGLFVVGANGVVACLDATNGKLIWQRDLKIDADRQPPLWGFSSSPLVIDGLVIVHAGGKDEKGLFAYNANDGSIAWSVPSGDHSYSSAQLATFDATRGILMVTNSGLQFVEISDGKEIWKSDWTLPNYRALQPLIVDHSVLISTSLGVGTRRTTVEHTPEGQWNITEDWTSRDMKPEFNDYVEYRGYVYGFDGNIFSCVDAKTGKRVWKKGRYGSGQVVLLSMAGQLLITTETGEIVLANATPEKLDEVAQFKAIEGKTWNHPVLVGDRLYLRNAEEAACFQMPLVVPNREETR